MCVCVGFLQVQEIADEFFAAAFAAPESTTESTDANTDANTEANTKKQRTEASGSSGPGSSGGHTLSKSF